MKTFAVSVVFTKEVEGGGLSIYHCLDIIDSGDSESAEGKLIKRISEEKPDYWFKSSVSLLVFDDVTPRERYEIT